MMHISFANAYALPSAPNVDSVVFGWDHIVGFALPPVACFTHIHAALFNSLGNVLGTLWPHSIENCTHAAS
jgi:hypothetical protein